MLLVKDVHIHRWRMHNTPERRIFTSVAANVLNTGDVTVGVAHFVFMSDLMSRYLWLQHMYIHLYNAHY